MGSHISSLHSTFVVTFTTIQLIPCEKLTKTANYNTWSVAVYLWFLGQGHGCANHLTYHRHTQSPPVVPLTSPPTSSPTSTAPSSLSSALDLLITLCKVSWILSLSLSPQVKP